MNTIVIAGFAKLPQSIVGKNLAGHIAIEFEINSADSKVVDIYCPLLSFVEKEILYQTCLANKIETGIKEAIAQLEKRFFGLTKQAIIEALEDAYKCYKKTLKEKTTGNLNIKIEQLMNKSNRSRPVRKRKFQAFCSTLSA